MLPLFSRTWRSWERDKGVAFLAILALAIGIGCATAIFTVVDTVLLRPLPYSHGERWIQLFAGTTSDPDRNSGLSFADLLAYEQQTHTFDVFGWFPVGGDFNLTFPGQPKHISGIEVSPSLIANLGARPAAGRFFTDSDGPNVALISHRLFQQFGPGIIGRAITLSGRSYTVLGAMPAWFRLPLVTVESQNSQNDVWLPINTPRNQDALRHYAFYTAYARLKPGVTVEQARAEAKRVASQLRKQNHPDDPTYTAALFSLQDAVVKSIRPILLLLLGAAGLLLFITCANVAGLLVSRSVGRARETAIRIALGGGQRQLALQYFSESLLVSLAALAAGIVASIVLVRVVVSLAADYIPRSDEISTNWPVALFALALAFLTATLSSLAPLWQALRTQPNEVLSDGVRASAGVRSRKLSHALVIAEIALAFTLISVGAVLVWQLNRLNRTWPGFDPDGTLTFELTRSGQGTVNAAASSSYADKLLMSLEAIPGVSGAALTNQLPLDGCCFVTSLFPGDRSRPGEFRQQVSLMIVNASYFKTLRIPLLAGRFLNKHDTNENLISVVLDEAAARRFWPRRNAVGQFARLGSSDGSRAQIVGVVGTVRNEGLGEDPLPEMYLLKDLVPINPMHFVVRSTLPQTALASAVRRAISQVDPNQPVYSIRSLPDILGDSLTFQRIESIVVTVFALAALLLACLGVYGLTSYSVRQRTTELGTRMALGATGRDLLRLVITDGLRLTVFGLLVGALAVAGASAAVVRYFSVHQLSPVPYLFSTAAVIVLGIIASFVPGWRASLLSPMIAIRNETDSIWTAARRVLERVRERISGEEPGPALESTLLTEFIEASRRADSFAEVLHTSLEDLRRKLSAASAFLLEKLSPNEYRCMAASPGGAPATFRIPETGFLLNRLRFYSTPLSFSSADLDTSLRWAREQRPGHVPELELLQTTGLRLAVPLRTKHDLIGLLLFGEPVARQSYRTTEKNLLAACAEQFALTLENARLNERVLEQEKVRRDIALATEVQKRLLPETSPHTVGSSLDAFTLAARGVGGDYYDFLQVGDRRLGIALADIAGKGIAAALIMAVVQASLRILAAEGNISLPELAARMNHFLHRSTGASSYATFFYAQVDEQSRQLRYVNAGHNPPYLLRHLKSTGSKGSVAEIEELATGGMIIGMFPSASYQESVIDLYPGDVLMAFTDGVTEALNPAEEEFGELRLKELLVRVAHLPMPEITAAISKELRAWIADAPQHDDITFIVLKVNEDKPAGK
ncbi:MAG: SpoIIE family protein phosphatase [Acidobacteriaceae bacterium]|nr:SpoIIE family protein phosphatase [Acidobacteriaceae bacterium]